MKKLLLMFVAVLVSVQVSLAQQTAVIDSELQQALDNESAELINVNIVLKSEADKTKLKALKKTAARRETVSGAVVGVLKKHAENSQAAVMALLVEAEKEGKASEISSHWMSNGITCNATKEVIYQMASHPDVLAIGYNKELKVVESVDEYDVEAAANEYKATPHVIQVGADDVWSQGYTGKNVVVAVLDSGTNPDHYDLKDHLWVGYADTDGDGEKDDMINGWNFVSDNSNIADDYGHGTHCAGIVCGDGTVGNITGVAPDATLMTVKIVNRAGGGSVAQMISGVEFAVENGAHVLSMSLGYKQSQIGTADIVALRRAFENTLEAGVVVCAAAGNDGNTQGDLKNIDYPAACPPPYIHPDQAVNSGGKTSVICVGSVNSNDEYAKTSSIGPVTWQGTEFGDYPYDDTRIGLIRPDVCAPGELIYSLKYDENNKYKLMSGTSQATPCVAGVIALMLEKNPALTPAQICETLETTAKKLSEKKDNYTGSGRVDALAAVNSVEAEGAKPFIELVSCSPAVVAPGKNINVDFELLNSGKGDADENVVARLIANDPYVAIVNGELDFGKIAGGKSVAGNFVIAAAENTPNGHTAYMKIVIASGGNLRHCDVAVKFVNEAKIVCTPLTQESLVPGSNKVVVNVKNCGTAATEGETGVAISTASPYVTVVNGETLLGTIGVNETKMVEFIVDVIDEAPDNSSVSFDVFATPGNNAAVKNIIYEFEQGFDDSGHLTDGFSGWTTFDASDDGRSHPWWHSSMAGTHRLYDLKDSYSGEGHFMSETYCQASMIEYTQPIDNYLVSPKVRIAPNSSFSFVARVHGEWYGEHFGVAVSEKGNSSAADFTTIKEWTINASDGNGWIRYEVDLSEYVGKDVYVAIRHYFTDRQWEELDNGYDVYILHVDDAEFKNVIDLSSAFVYNNYSYFSLNVEGNPLPAPDGVAATVVDGRTIALSWTAVPNAQAYNIYRDGEFLATASALSYTDTGLASDTEYVYSVSAVYNGKEYERSAGVTAVTGKADYSVKILSVAPGALSVGENVIEITLVNNGIYEQKSRSTVTLATDDSYAEIVNPTAGMKYLKVGEEYTCRFTVMIKDDIPDGHAVKFNLNVTELFEDKNSWDCPFSVVFGDSDVSTTIESPREEDEAAEVYDMSGRRIVKPTKGIYVVNGKKVYVRQ